MSEQRNIPIAEDLLGLYSRMTGRVFSDVSAEQVRRLIERCSRVEARNELLLKTIDDQGGDVIRLVSEVAQLKAEQENVALRNKLDRLKASLGLIYDRWENGTPCSEAGEGGQIEEGASSLGNAIKLSFAEEQEILNLIVDRAEDFEQTCANCNKPYQAHLLHDGNKCSPGSVNGWFPSIIADAVVADRGPADEWCAEAYLATDYDSIDIGMLSEASRKYVISQIMNQTAG